MGEPESAVEDMVKLQEMNRPFSNIYNGKTVLITGHTGFKGSWLTIWLTRLGAKVVGYSAYLPSKPNNFEICDLENRIVHIKGDIRDIDKLNKVFMDHNPDIVFHLAAQPIVRKSYEDPKLTFDTNIGGTVNILDCVRKTNSVKAMVIITSDKCYRNDEWVWGYRENDRLGGDDPYSGSKACAEIVSNSYIKSFFKENTSTRIATTRAGNVIGGGDWADSRIVPDCVKAWADDKEVFIRNPNSTRPWQHVLEPLSGYIWLGYRLLNNTMHGEAFNFGPDQRVNQSVSELIKTFIQYWGNAKWKSGDQESDGKESNLLKLSCDKALHLLKWQPVLSFKESVKMTAEWYKNYYEGSIDMHDFTVKQIEAYTAEAFNQSINWATNKDIKV